MYWSRAEETQRKDEKIMAEGTTIPNSTKLLSQVDGKRRFESIVERAALINRRSQSTKKEQTKVPYATIEQWRTFFG